MTDIESVNYISSLGGDPLEHRLALRDFVRESNRIEGILRPPTEVEIAAHEQFLAAPPTVDRLADFVASIAPGHVLRDRAGLDVRVGKHIAPEGGATIWAELNSLCVAAPAKGFDPFLAHCRYEMLHPFTDGNGRSGRALWLWMMIDHGDDPYVLVRGFLHTFYYQTLSRYEQQGIFV